MLRVKVLVIGPCEGGKTTISNFLSDASDSNNKDYRPTQGVRILEFESPSLSVNNKYVKAEIELWDCSGDHKFESSWPAMQQKDIGGIVLVYNPERDGHIRELEGWYSRFVEQQGVQDSQCFVVANRKNSIRERRGRLSGTFARVHQVDVNLEEDGNRLRSDFMNFLSSIITNIAERREQEELTIMNMR